jgi:hypothetical protein
MAESLWMKVINEAKPSLRNGEKSGWKYIAGEFEFEFEFEFVMAWRLPESSRGRGGGLKDCGEKR